MASLEQLRARFANRQAEEKESEEFTEGQYVVHFCDLVERDDGTRELVIPCRPEEKPTARNSSRLGRQVTCDACRKLKKFDDDKDGFQGDRIVHYISPGGRGWDSSKALCGVMIPHQERLKGTGTPTVLYTSLQGATTCPDCVKLMPEHAKPDSRRGPWHV